MLYSSFIDCLSNLFSIYLCVHWVSGSVCVGGDHLLSLFNIAHTYMHLGLTTRDWITYQGAHPRRKLILLSPAIDSP